MDEKKIIIFDAGVAVEEIAAQTPCCEGKHSLRAKILSI